MSFVEELVKETPNKYNSLIETRVLDRSLELKVKQYNALQTEFDQIVRDATVNAKPPSGGWNRIGGGLKQISSAGKDFLWGVNRYDSIYTCKKPCDDSNWRQIGGSLKQLTGGDDEVWGVNSVNDIYKMNQNGTGGWSHIGGKASNVSQGGGYVWVVGGNNSTYYCREPCNGEWSLASQPSDEWTLVFRQTNDNWNWNKNNGGNRNIDKNAAGNYSQLENLEKFRGSDGKLTFKMTYPGNSNLSSPQIWKQTSNPWTVRNNRNGQVDGYEAISVPYTGDQWGGLRWNGGPCLISGSKNNWWWYAIGSFRPYGNNSIPGANSIQVSKTELYVKNKTNEPSIVQLSCNNNYVYGVDTNKNAWRRPINGSGKWEKFGNPNNWKFYWINASNNKDVFAIGMSRWIYKTDIDGKQEWTRADNVAAGVATVSGDPESEDFYITNTSDAIYRHTPEQAGGFWQDIPNENYMYGMVPAVGESTNDFKYLGKTNDLDECKLKAVNDKKNEYSSVVYTSKDFDGSFKSSCYGNIKGGNKTPKYQNKITTSLAPNGTSRLGGEKGMKILKQMKKKAKEIEQLVKNVENKELGATNDYKILSNERKTTGNDLDILLGKLRKDRIKINKLMNRPDVEAVNEDGYDRQLSNYIIYFFWILIVIISIGLCLHLLNSESVSVITYLFVAIWLLILCKYYYSQIIYYGGQTLNYVSSVMVDTVN
uniref:Uncharacterized protein n=1 Tax=viral metagenome TaxID=1070528 RepID=A0A6C0CJD2_9ZZZZ